MNNTLASAAATETITVNRQNWSGESMEVAIDRVNQTFTIAHYRGYVFGLQGPKVVDDFQYYKISIDGQLTDSTVGRFDGDREWTAMGMGIDREHRDPFVAAALVIAMTL